MAAPVQRDEELELKVDSLAYGGNGVARGSTGSSSSCGAGFPATRCARG